METWKATIKERGNDMLLTPSYTFTSGSGFEYIQDEREREYEVRKFLIKFWGLNREDVQWYTVEKETTKINEVTAFMHYMFNKWNKSECLTLFGKDLGQHIWNKWNEEKSFGSFDRLRWYASLDNECRQKLVDHANSTYGQ